MAQAIDVSMSRHSLGLLNSIREKITLSMNIAYHSSFQDPLFASQQPAAVFMNRFVVRPRIGPPPSPRHLSIHIF